MNNVHIIRENNAPVKRSEYPDRIVRNHSRKSLKPKIPIDRSYAKDDLKTAQL
jgi:hypothetical protein